MGAAVSFFWDWISSVLQHYLTPHLMSVHDAKSAGDDVLIFRATHRATSPGPADFTTVLRIPDAKPLRFVLSIERYAGPEADGPAEHCEVQFTGIAHETGSNLRLTCAHVSLANALDEAAMKRFYPCALELQAVRDWDGTVHLDLSAISDRAVMPEWLFTDSVPTELHR